MYMKGTNIAFFSFSDRMDYQIFIKVFYYLTEWFNERCLFLNKINLKIKLES